MEEDGALHHQQGSVIKQVDRSGNSTSYRINKRIGQGYFRFGGNYPETELLPDQVLPRKTALRNLWEEDLASVCQHARYSTISSS